jgi:hypothetical protein
MTTLAAPAAQATPEPAPASPVVPPVVQPPVTPKAGEGAAHTQQSLPGGILGGEPAPKDGAGGEAKAEPAAKATEPVPAELKVTLPDGAKLDESILKGLTSEAAKLKLTSEQASGLAAYLATEQKASEERDVAEWTKRSDDWLAAVKADKDFGGANFDATKAHAQAAVLKAGGPELAAEIQAWGLTNAPFLVKGFARLGKLLGEDTSTVDKALGGAPGSVSDEKAKLEVRYDHPDSVKARQSGG